VILSWDADAAWLIPVSVFTEASSSWA